MARYRVTEVKLYECSCDPNVKFTEKELKAHVRSHKVAGDRVFFEASGGYSYEM